MVEADNPSVSPAVTGVSKALTAASKKKRNLPGMPDPDAEVVALSPKELLATNRFICEICKKGFQRDQNLQLHRRGHNLPWKLRQRSSDEIRKRVYVCPEPTCVHHDPARALGDLTGIKKHFSRKHGEKKYRCDRCSKKYAVLSDLKAHAKTCGTREYRCDCGTLFSRRDSFVTHRAFCDALAQETARSHYAGDLNVQVMGPPLPAASSSPPPPRASTDVLSPGLPVQTSAAAELSENQNVRSAAVLIGASSGAAAVSSSSSITSRGGITDHGGPICVFDASASELTQPSLPPPSFTSMLRPAISGAVARSDPVSLTLSPSLYGAFPPFPGVRQNPRPNFLPSSSPALSATALLLKATQMGSTSSNSTFLHGLGFPPPPPDRHDAISGSARAAIFPPHFNTSVIGQSALFPDKADAPQDFLRLGTGGGFLNSLSSAADISGDSFPGLCPGLGGWEDSSDRKPSAL